MERDRRTAASFVLVAVAAALGLTASLSWWEQADQSG